MHVGRVCRSRKTIYMNVTHIFLEHDQKGEEFHWHFIRWGALTKALERGSTEQIQWVSPWLTRTLQEATVAAEQYLKGVCRERRWRTSRKEFVGGHLRRETLSLWRTFAVSSWLSEAHGDQEKWMFHNSELNLDDLRVDDRLIGGPATWIKRRADHFRHVETWGMLCQKREIQMSVSVGQLGSLGRIRTRAATGQEPHLLSSSHRPFLSLCFSWLFRASNGRDVHSDFYSVFSTIKVASILGPLSPFFAVFRGLSNCPILLLLTQIDCENWASRDHVQRQCKREDFARTAVSPRAGPFPRNSSSSLTQFNRSFRQQPPTNRETNKRAHRRTRFLWWLFDAKPSIITDRIHQRKIFVSSDCPRIQSVFVFCVFDLVSAFGVSYRRCRTPIPSSAFWLCWIVLKVDRSWERFSFS